MTQVTVSTNAAQVSNALREFFGDQVPFAASKAINRVLNEAQAAQREHMRGTFKQNRPEWQAMNVKIRGADRATKQKLEGVIRMEAPGGRRTDILAKFETEEWKVPFSSTSIFVPTEAILGADGSVMRGWRPKDLRFRHHGVKSDRVKVGRRRTFMILEPGLKSGVVFERERGDDPEPIYFIEPKVDIDPNLDFVPVVTETVERRFTPLFEEAWNAAVRSAGW